MTLNLWLDDIRVPKEGLTHYSVYKDAEHLIEMLEILFKHRVLKSDDKLVLYLDHDLGEGMSGYDFCKQFVDLMIDYGDDRPQLDYEILTNNPVGRDNMVWLLENFKHHFYEENE